MSDTPVAANAAGSAAGAAPLPKFEQTLASLLALLNSAGRDEPVKNSLLLDWLLPLLEDARDEYTALASDNADQIDSLADDAVDASPDENARQVVVAVVGLAAVAFQRAGWLGQDLALTPLCPKDLADEYSKVQALVQAWGETLAQRAGDDDDDDGGAA